MTFMKNILVKIPATLILALLVLGWSSLAFSSITVNAQANRSTGPIYSAECAEIVATQPTTSQAYKECVEKSKAGAFNSNTTQTGGNIASFQILPFNNIFDLMNAVVEFLRNLAVPLAILVITWGGYKYFIGGLDGKGDGLKAIQAGIIGLAIVLSAQLITTITQGTFTTDGFNANAIEPILDQGIGFLTALASVTAVLVIVWGGYKYFFSTLPGAKENGKKNIEQGITGLVIVIIAQPIVTIINSTIGVQNDQLSLDPQSLISTAQVIITKFLIPVSSVVTVGLFIWAGYLWISSQGDPGTVKKAKDSFFNAIIGLIVVLLAVTITQLIVFFVRTDSVTPSSNTSSSTSSTRSTTTGTTNNSTTTGTTGTVRPNLN